MPRGRRRSLKHALFKPTPVLDENDRFVLERCSEYLVRLLSRYPLTDQETLAMVQWVVKEDIHELGQFLLDHLTGSRREWLLEKLGEAEDDMEDYTSALSRALEKAPRALQGRAVRRLVNLLKQKGKRSCTGRSEMEKGLKVFRKMFQLSEPEIRLVEFLYLNATRDIMENYFISHLSCTGLSGRKYLAAALGLSSREINEALSGTLERIDFFDKDYERKIAANDSFLNFLANPDETLLVRKFFTRLTGRTLPLDRHPIEKEQTEHLLALLGKTGPTSTHILLYGDPGTGKTSYAQGLIRALKQTGYQIVRDEENKTSNRRAAIVACLNLTRKEPRPIIIVDEADNLLNTEYSWFRRGETQDKGWLNQLLEVPGLRMIWITNDIGSIEDSVLRRFAYSLRFKPFNRRQRLQLWENVLKGQQAKSRLDGPEVLALAKKYRVSAGGVELVVRKALEAGRTEKKAFHRAVELGLSAHQTLLNGGIEKQNDPDRIETGYCLEGLNLEGNPRELMTRLDQFNRYLRQTDRKEIRNFNLLFYGPPGTGKSELARYIAEQLDRELIVKRASDLLNAYVGATEQLIRRAFEEAEREEAVLVLDEADTFLFSRDRAVRSWEISFTNEFLTQMERYRGILICTTNRMTDLDQASIRRFNHKIRFDYLTPEGNRIFYERFLKSMIQSRPAPARTQASL